MERQSLRRFYGRQVFKGALFASTALVLPIAAPRLALAQPAPNTTPQGGQVVGGSASITQAPASTTINQSSQNAAINWQSFDIGAAAKVQFNQPNAAAIALNRVVGGNLSQINGQINANGQIVLINQSGVVFGKGSQVNAESVVVSTSDIATSDFMAGRMNFSGAPKPGAQIINNGNITARDAGLVGLIAPQVANNGLITASLGQVILAGASAFTLDLYGDKLISLDVTRAVRAVDVGGKLVPALVVNNGAILADGGKITLTAQDADALVTQLINAGGVIRADTVGAQTGAISVQGVGGNISIAGNLLARGTAAGTKGGAVQALTTGAVSVAPGAVIDVSGAAGGGIAALGTNLLRAQTGPSDVTAPKAASVDIAAGAAIHADATGIGNAGTVTVLSQNRTDFAGAITARGGAQGGNGGLTELSSDGIINLSGTVLETAINGRAGEILLDPATLIVTIGGASSTSASQVSPNYLDSLGGNVLLSATSLLEVLSPVDMASPNTTLSLISGGNISIASAVTVNGSLYINATGVLNLEPEVNGGNVLQNLGGITASNIFLNAGTSINIDAQISAAQTLDLISSGPINEGAATALTGLILHNTIIPGGIDAGTLTDENLFDGTVLLNNTASNSIANVLDFTVANGGSLYIFDSAPLVIGDNVAAGNAVFFSDGGTAFGVSITGHLNVPGQLVFDSTKPVLEDAGASIATGTLALFGNAGAGTISLTSGHNTIHSLGIVGAVDTLVLNDGAVLNISGPTTIASAFTFETGGLNETGTGALDVPVFAGLNLSGDAILSNANTISTLAGFSGAGSFALNDSHSLLLTKNVSAENIFLTAPGLGLQSFTLSASTGGTLALTADTITAGGGVSLAAAGGTIAIAPLTATDNINISAAGAHDGTLLVGNNLLVAIENSGLAALLLGGDSQSGNITLGDATIAAINLGTATLDIQTSGTINQAALTLAAGTLAFDGAGYTEATAGSIVTSLITGNGGPITGNVLLNGAGNKVASLSNITISGGHELSLFDTASPLSAAALRAGTIALDAGSLTLAGNISAATAATLDSAGTIFQSAGILSAGSLTGTAGGAITLGDANVIGTLGPLSASGAILLNSSAFTIAGTISTPDALTLKGGGATELASGGIKAATLTSAGTTISGTVDLTAGQNTITTLTNFLVGTGFGLNLDDTGLLNLAGTVSAGHASLTADTLALGGALDVTGLLALGSQNGLTQTAGTLNAGTLASAGAINGGDVSLADANSIGTLANFNVAAGNFTLNTSGTLDITGVLNDAGSLILLTADGLTETGAIIAATLASTGTFGDALLTGANSISTLSGFDLTGDFALNDSLALTLDGLLRTGTNKTVSFGGVSVTEDANGTIVAGTLGGAGRLSGDAVLTQANTISAVDGLTLGGTLDLTDTRAFAIGNLKAASATFANATASTLDVTGFLSVAGTLLLDLTDATLLESGSITASDLESGVATIASAVLDGVNHIATLGAFDATGTFDLTDASALTITNNLTAAGVNLADSSLLDIEALVQANAAGVALAAPSVSIGAAGNIDLVQSGQVFSVAADSFANAGIVAAPSGTFAIAPYNFTAIDLGGTAANALDLTGTDFAIADLSELIIGRAAGHTAANVTIDDFSAGSSIALLSLFASGVIADNGLLAANNIAISGAGFTQNAGGSIVTGTLSAGGPVSGNVSLGNATNSISALGPITLSNGDFTLNDQVSLNVAGGILAKDITLEDLVAIALGAPVSVNNGGTIELIADALTDTGAAINAGAAGTVEIYPYTSGTEVDLGGSTAGGLELSAGLISLISAGVLALGTASSAIYAEGSVSITPGELLLTATGLNFEGTLAGPGLLSLSATGAITEGAAAALVFATIAGAAGGTGLGGQNTIGTIGDFSASGNILLNDFASLFIEGTVQTPGDISLEGSYFQEIGQGALFAATLNSGGTEINGDVYLTNSNSIATIDDFTVGPLGKLIFDGGEALTLGAVTAPTATFSAPSLDFSGAFSATGILALQSTGNVTQTGGTIRAGTLISLGSIGGNLLLGDANAILTLGGVSLGTSGTLELTDASTLTITGPVTAPITTLSAAGITFDGDLDAATRLVLASTGNIQQTGGAITTGTLSSLGTIAGNLGLGLSNSIATISNVSLGANHTLSVNDAGAMTLAGAIVAPFATFSAASLDLRGDIDAQNLLAFGAPVTQNAGGITAATLASQATIAGDIILLDANTIGTLGAINLTGNFALNDTGPLTIAGTLATPGLVRLENAASILETTGLIDAATFDTGGTTIGGNLILNNFNQIGTLGAVTAVTAFDLTDAANLKIAGTVFAPALFVSADNIAIAGALNGTILTLASAGTISESTGTIGVATLTGFGSIGGDADLTNANAIGTLTNFTMATGAVLDLTDNQTLTLAGTIVAPNASFTAPGLIFDGAINAGNVLALTGSSITTEGADGDITAGTLTSNGSVDGSVFLLGTNHIGTIADFLVSATSSFALNNGTLLTVAGPLTGGFITLSASTIDIGGAIDAPFTTLAAGQITLETSGAITAASTLNLRSAGGVTGGGFISTGLLTTGLGSIGGDLSLTGANSITALGDVRIGGNALINDAALLTIAGLLDVTGQTLALQDSAGIQETTGTIIAATLSSGAATDGNVFLLGAANSIAALGNVAIAASGTFALADTGTLALNGNLTASFATLTVPTLAISGTIAGGYLALLNDDFVTETTGGLLNTATLTSQGASDGDIFLGNANAIGTIGNFTVGGADTLAVLDAGAMNLAGTIMAPFATLAAGTLNISGVLDIADQLALGGTGAISELAGGTIDARTGTLVSYGSIAGSVSLLNGNSIAALGSFQTGGNFAFDDQESYVITGLVATGTAGSMMLMGAGFAETGAGAIDTGTLTSAGNLIAGGATLNGANSIATLSDFAASGDVLVNDLQKLVLGGTIKAAILGLMDSGNISQSGGGIIATALNSDGGQIGGGVTLNAAHNSISTLGAFAAVNGLALQDSVGLAIAGNVNLGGTLALSDTGSINQTGGSIIAAALSSDGGTIGGSAVFNQTYNQIATISNFSALGALSVHDNTNLALTGIINPATGLFLFTNNDNIQQTGGSIVTGLLDVSGANIAIGSGNNITTLGAAGAAGNLFVNGVGIIAGPVNADNATIAAPNGGLVIRGNINASGNLSLISAGYLQQLSGTIDAGSEYLIAGQIGLAGIDLAAATLSAVAQGQVSQTAGLLSAGAIDLVSSHAGVSQAAGARMNAADIYLTGQSGGVTVAGALSATSNIGLSGAAGVTDDATLLQAENASLVSENAVNLNGVNIVAGRLSVRGNLIDQQSGGIQAGTLAAYGNNLGIILNGNVVAQNATLNDAGVYGQSFAAGVTGVQLGGDISIANALDIISGNGIYLTGGAVHAGSLYAVSDVDAATNRIVLNAGALYAGATTLIAGAGISIASAASIAGQASLRSAGVIDISGVLSAANADLTATGDAALNGHISIANLLDVTATAGAISQTSGTITAQNASLGSHGGIVLDGISRIADDLYLRAGGNILATTGSIAAGTLTGNDTGPGNEQALFTGNNRIGTIGSFVMQDSTFALNDSGPLTLIGPLVANAVSLMATGLLTLEGSTTGGLFIAGTLAPKTQTMPAPGDSSITVMQAAGGAEPAIVQTGTFYVDSGPLAGQYPGFANMPATLFFTMLPFGTINFAPAPPNGDGLVAPSIDAVFSPGNGGTISGNVDLLSLLLVSGRATNLTGMLDGLSGEAASGKGSVVPFPKPVFQFNACPIGSVNCIILPIETLPPGDPLQNFDIDQRKKKRLDKNVALPGVATRDF
jgi:filamentous hemagglutinin family protein